MHLFVNDLFVLSRAHMGIYVTLSIFQFTWILIVKTTDAGNHRYKTVALVFISVSGSFLI